MRDTKLNHIIVGIIFIIIYIPFTWASYFYLGGVLTLNSTSVSSWLSQFDDLNVLAIRFGFIIVFKLFLIGFSAIATAVVIEKLEEKGMMK